MKKTRVRNLEKWIAQTGNFMERLQKRMDRLTEELNALKAKEADTPAPEVPVTNP